MKVEIKKEWGATKKFSLTDYLSSNNQTNSHRLKFPLPSMIDSPVIGIVMRYAIVVYSTFYE